jgi:hypothetical protein
MLRWVRENEPGAFAATFIAGGLSWPEHQARDVGGDDVRAGVVEVRTCVGVQSAVLRGTQRVYDAGLGVTWVSDEDYDPNAERVTN